MVSTIKVNIVFFKRDIICFVIILHATVHEIDNGLLNICLGYLLFGEAQTVRLSVKKLNFCDFLDWRECLFRRALE